MSAGRAVMRVVCLCLLAGPSCGWCACVCWQGRHAGGVPVSAGRAVMRVVCLCLLAGASFPYFHFVLRSAFSQIFNYLNGALMKKLASHDRCIYACVFFVITITSQWLQVRWWKEQWMQVVARMQVVEGTVDAGGVDGERKSKVHVK